MDLTDKFPNVFPSQHQNNQPGNEEQMKPTPIYELDGYNRACRKLEGKVAVITGGDSGIGRAVAIAFAQEGAKLAILYLNEHEDGEKTKKLVEQKGAQCILISGDIGEEQFCKTAVKQVVDTYGTIDILINNAGEQHPQDKLEYITTEQLMRTFNTNFFGAFFMTKAAIPHLKKGATIINTTSVVAYKGHETLIDYSATKGALTSFTRSLALNLAPNGIRVNAVAPGPIWTPLIPSSFDQQKVVQFGSNTPIKRAGQPVELAQAYVFLASQDSSFVIGETIHINGGEIING